MNVQNYKNVKEKNDELNHKLDFDLANHVKASNGL